MIISKFEPIELIITVLIRLSLKEHVISPVPVTVACFLHQGDWLGDQSLVICHWTLCLVVLRINEC